MQEFQGNFSFASVFKYMYTILQHGFYLFVTIPFVPLLLAPSAEDISPVAVYCYVDMVHSILCTSEPIPSLMASKIYAADNGLFYPYL